MENKPNTRDVSKKKENNLFFSQDTLSYIPENTFAVELKRHSILKFIAKNPNSTIYRIAKGVSMAYTQAHQAMKELLFARLVCVRQGFDSNGKVCEVFFLPPKLKKGGEDGDQ